MKTKRLECVKSMRLHENAEALCFEDASGPYAEIWVDGDYELSFPSHDQATLEAARALHHESIKRGEGVGRLLAQREIRKALGFPQMDFERLQDQLDQALIGICERLNEQIPNKPF